MELSIDVPWERLNEAICQRERDTRLGMTVIMIPDDPREPIRMTLDGKPIPNDVTPERALAVAIGARR